MNKKSMKMDAKMHYSLNHFLDVFGCDFSSQHRCKMELENHWFSDNVLIIFGMDFGAQRKGSGPPFFSYIPY